MRLVASITLCLLPLAAVASEPRFWTLQAGNEFLAGETRGLAVDSEGRLRIAVASELAAEPDAPNVWSIAAGRGTLFLGTGNDGQVLAVDASGKVEVLLDADEPEVHAVAYGPDGRVYAATSPDGRVHSITSEGEVATFFDPPDRYIWSMAFGADGALFVATGGRGRLYRVAPDGTHRQVFESKDMHLTAVAADPRGGAYAGSSPSGIVYRVDSDLKVFAVHDSGYQEVKALEQADDGGVYAAVVGTAQATSTTAPPADQAANANVSVTVVTPAPEPGDPGAEAQSAAPPTPAQPPAAGTQPGAVLRIRPDGAVERLWSSGQQAPHSLVRSRDGVLVGTGDEGRLYRVRDDHTWSMEQAFPGKQVTAISSAADGGLALATSNPGRVYRLSNEPGREGSFVSAVHDAGVVSAWGRVTWEAVQPPNAVVSLESRSGNTATPDATWSDWSAPHTDPASAAVASEDARFLQLRATLKAAGAGSPVVSSIRTAYLQRNLPPEVVSITVYDAGQVFQKPMAVTPEAPILGLDPAAGPGGTAPPAIPALPMGNTLFRRGLRTFAWQSRDANGDRLAFDVEYRGETDERFRSLRAGLEDPVFTWDTSLVPDGRYVLRVTADDAPSNPSQLALRGSRESRVFDVDNTPPLVSLRAEGAVRVEALVVDAASPIKRLEYSVDGERWWELHPVDGIADSPEETFSIPLDGLAGGTHLVVVRATDQLGNVSVARVEVQSS